MKFLNSSCCWSSLHFLTLDTMLTVSTTLYSCDSNDNELQRLNHEPKQTLLTTRTAQGTID